MSDKFQSHCRDYFSCRCVDDPKTIRKHVFIELTSKCNFNCDFCVYRFSKRKKEFMNLELLEKILKDLKKLKPIEYVMFSALGEPMLYPKFKEACFMVKKFGYHLIVTTDGSLLKEEHKNLPIDELYISLQTPTKKSFKLRNSGNLKFDDYIDKICNFVKDVHYHTCIYLLKENKFFFPKYKGFINPESKNSIKLIEKIGKKINLNFRIRPSKDKNLPRFINILPNLNLSLSNLVSWSNCIVPENMEIEEAEFISDCSYYKHHVNILSNGEVTFCCMDYDAKMSLGNVKKESLKKIYSRKKRNIDLARFPFCRKCKGILKPKE